jgi:hypothetical protein
MFLFANNHGFSLELVMVSVNHFSKRQVVKCSSIGRCISFQIFYKNQSSKRKYDSVWY